MSREIKFRAYDKKKEMWTNYQILDDTIFCIDKVTGVWHNHHHERFKDFGLSQYTGLKDKNGKEIYEGDILRYNFPYDMRLSYISPVSYLDTQSSFGIIDSYGNNIPLYDISANHYFEVIGNIYENKNLLEENR